MATILPNHRLDAIRFSLNEDVCADAECELLRNVLHTFVDPPFAHEASPKILARVRALFMDFLQAHAPRKDVTSILQRVLNEPTTAVCVEDDAGARLAAISELALALLRFNEHVHL